MPLSDGGEGLLDLQAPLALRMVVLEVQDPLGRPVTARYGFSSEKSLAVVEMAEASGLQRLKPEERDPRRTSTFGTGEMLLDALKRGAKRLVLGIGGSATNDAGIGMAAALGWRFLDRNGNTLPPDGGHMAEIARIQPPVNAAMFDKAEVLCDVTNPLYGPAGAAWVYGRQKGGNDESLAALDAGLAHVSQLLEAQLGRPGLARTPGAGAAGGLGFGALAFLNGQLTRGIDAVLALTGFVQAAARAQLIITGEGHIDAQSIQGKLIQGVCRRAGRVPVIALCGKLSASPAQLAEIGLRAAYVINRQTPPLPKCWRRPRKIWNAWQRTSRPGLVATPDVSGTWQSSP